MRFSTKFDRQTVEHELISESDYSNLPEEPDMKFAALELICRKNMNRLIASSANTDFDDLVRLEYMTTVSSAASAVGIEDLSYSYDGYPERAFQGFLMSAIGCVTRIRMQQGGANRAFSVELSRRTKGRIEIEIRKLRDIIAGSSLPEDRRAALIQKLAELSGELEQPRMSFGKVFAVLAYVSLGVANGTSFLADAPQALATISSLIGKDKSAEEAEAARLGRTPQKLLPAPQKSTPPPRGFDRAVPMPTSDTTDDDIPF